MFLVIIYFSWYQNMEIILTVASLFSFQRTTQLRASEPLTSVKVPVSILGGGGGVLENLLQLTWSTVAYYTDFGLNHSIKNKVTILICCIHQRMILFFVVFSELVCLAPVKRCHRSMALGYVPFRTCLNFNLSL